MQVVLDIVALSLGPPLKILWADALMHEALSGVVEPGRDLLLWRTPR